MSRCHNLPMQNELYSFLKTSSVVVFVSTVVIGALASAVSWLLKYRRAKRRVIQRRNDSGTRLQVPSGASEKRFEHLLASFRQYIGNVDIK